MRAASDPSRPGYAQSILGKWITINSLDPELEDRPGRMAEGNRIENAILADLESRHLSRLALIG